MRLPLLLRAEKEYSVRVLRWRVERMRTVLLQLTLAYLVAVFATIITTTASAEEQVATKAPADDADTARRAELERSIRNTEAQIEKTKIEIASYDDKVQLLRVKGKVTHRDALKDETGRTLQDYESLIEDAQKKLKILELAADSARLDLETLKKKSKAKE